MKHELLVPRLNTNDDEMDVVHCYVSNREYVEKGKEIVDLESSKAVVSIESEASGYIWCHFQTGDTVKVGALLVTVYAELQELEADLNRGSSSQNDRLVQATITSGELSQVSVAIAPDRLMPVVAVGRQDSDERVPVVLGDPSDRLSFGFTRFSKAAQDYIERHQIDSNLFEGMGLVSVKAIETRLGICQTVVSPANLVKLPESASKNGQKAVDASTTDPELRSDKVSKSKQLEISLLTAGQSGGINSSLTVQFDSASIRQTLQELDSLNGQMLPLILFELARLLEEYPAFTAYYEAGKIYYYDRIDLGLAIDLGKGLKVPVIRNANHRSPTELLETIVDFATRYLDNQLTVESLTGGTITISDLSSENILHFQPLINQHQSVILGIGGDSSIDSHPMTLTMVFDHRILAGREVGLFLNALKARLMSYQLTNLPVTENAVRARKIACNRCLIDLESLYHKFNREALMHVHVDNTGQTAYICHVCMGGF
jgi:pyruvate/2-oxoglutarate dehydrogenase complex dihydrolipoamide acyltransferase (E2) component